MTDKSKQKKRQYNAIIRAVYTTLATISLGIISTVLGLLILSPSIGVLIAVLLILIGVIGLGCIATLITYEMDRQEKLEDAQQQTQDMKIAVKQGMVEALREVLQGDNETLKATIKEMLLEELARSNLQDNSIDTSTTSDDDTGNVDDSKQNG
jgi:ABC-type transport system involved in multi-copper enzyme maturation permease subunit